MSSAIAELSLARRTAAPWKFWAAAALAVGLPLFALVALSTPLVSIILQGVIYSILALSVGFLIKQSGITSFGHACWFGLGAYICAVGPTATDLREEVFIIAAPIAVGAIALLVGLVITRLPGFAFSMVTLAIGQAAFEAAVRTRWLINGGDGFVYRLPSEIFWAPSRVFYSPQYMLVICWSVLLAVLGLLTLFRRSSFGLVTEAIRENEERARFLGFETLLPRAIVYAISAVVAAVAGVLFVLYSGFVSPELLNWSVSGSALIMALIGGTGTLWGPVLGAVTFFFARDSLVGSTEHWMMMTGIALILVTVLWPSGMAGALKYLAGRLGGRQTQ